MDEKHLKKILIKTKKAVFSQKIGNNTSKFKGEGYDFAELKEYEDGEDVRKIDWVISAKLNKPYVKHFYSQRELDIHIVTLLGGSVHFGTKIFKQELITQIAVMIGYSAVSQGDKFSSFIANTQLEIKTKPTKSILAVEKMAQTIAHYDPIGKEIDYKVVMDQLYKKIKNKSIIIFIGDFIDTEFLDLNLLGKKHEVISIIVRDKFEEDPKALGGVDLIDPSNNSKFIGELNDDLIGKYKKAIQTNDDKLFKDFKKWRVEYMKLYTDDNVLAKLMKLFY